MTALLSPNGFKFPERRDSAKGEWTAIYLEPVIGSGERICIGVAALTRDAGMVVPVVALDRLECIYGKQVDSVLLASRLALDYTRDLLSRDGDRSLRAWKPPIEGVFLGKPAPCEGVSLEEIARTGLTASSSLVEKLADTEAEQAGAAGSLTTNRLEELIKALVVAARPPLEGRFRVQRKIRENARASVIGFIGNTIAANFGMLMPGRLSPLVDISKAKLWDLAQLREDTKRDMFLTPLNRFELLVYRPRDEAAEYSERQMKGIQEAVVELEAEADKVEIRCRPATSHEEIANVLLEAEAA